MADLVLSSIDMKKTKKVYHGPSHRQGWGTEPTWEGALTEEEINSKLASALNWYSANSTPEQHKAWALEYFDNHGVGSPTELRSLRQIRDVEFHLCGILARIANRGCKLPARTNASFLAARDRLLAGKGVAKIVEPKKKDNKEKAPPKPKAVVRDPQVSVSIGAIDGLMDDITEGKLNKVPDAKAWGGDKLDQKSLKQVQQRFKHYVDEIRAALSKEDEQLVEAYSNFPPARLKRYYDFLMSIMNTVSTIVPVTKKMSPAQVRRAQEKAAVKAAKTLQKTVSKVLYKTEDQALGMTSADPRDIPGALMLWFFNTKTNRLGVYNSLHPTGLNVHRTTITDYNEGTSLQKKVPKNKVKPLLQEFMAKTKVQVEKWFKSLRTAEKPVNCRLNRDTLLLKIIK